MKNNVIYRSISSFDAVEENSRKISGYAVVFESWSRVMVDEKGYFVEKINRGAITEDLLYSSDVIMNVDHDNSKMLARWNRGDGTLRLELREEGLYFSFECPDTALGDEVLYNVRHGNLFECSFACTLNYDDMKRYTQDGERKVEIEKITGLYDCSIVVHAAYPSTSVYNRDGKEEEFENVDNSLIIDKFDEDEKREKEEERLQEEERLKQENEERAAKQLIINELDEKLKEFYKNINI